MTVCEKPEGVEEETYLFCIEMRNALRKYCCLCWVYELGS